MADDRGPDELASFLAERGDHLMRICSAGQMLTTWHLRYRLHRRYGFIALQ